MRPVRVAGVGKTSFGAFADLSLADLSSAAIHACSVDAGLPLTAVDALYVGNFDAPSFVGQNHVAPYVASAVGLSGIPATRFEAACASGGSALFHAWQAVAAGLYENVLVVGLEKMTTQSSARAGEILAGAGDCRREAAAGATFPALFALIARRYFHEYGATREHLAHVAVKNHTNACLNPEAHLRKAITLEQALAGKPIADPLTLFDCSLVSDGAAALWLTASPAEVEIRACAQASGPLALADKSSLTSFPATVHAARTAYSQAGISPGQVQVAEVHDCFTIAELIALEDLSFFAPGAAASATAAGQTALSGPLPVNPSGGLKAKGHPIGATGVAQVCELVVQLRGSAGKRQVKQPTFALAQNLGGSGATSVVTILERTA
jgi:acetyl-CoA C-acetyltransferase